MVLDEGLAGRRARDAQRREHSGVRQGLNLEDLLEIKLSIGAKFSFSSPSYACFSKLYEKHAACGTKARTIETVSGLAIEASRQLEFWDPSTEVALLLSRSVYCVGDEELPLLPGYPIQDLADLKEGARLRREGGPGKTSLLVINREVFKELCGDVTFHDAIINIVQAAHPKVPMPDESIDLIRKVRYLGIKDIIHREAIEQLNNRILSTLNPERATIRQASEGAPREIPPEEQLWRMLEIAGSFTLYLPPDKLLELAQEAREHAKKRGLNGESETASEALNYYLDRLELLDGEIHKIGLRGCNRAIGRVTDDPEKQEILKSVLLKLSYLIIATNPSLEGRGRELDGLLSRLTLRLNNQAMEQYRQEHSLEALPLENAARDIHFEILNRLFDEQIEALFDELVRSGSMKSSGSKIHKLGMAVRLNDPSVRRVGPQHEAVLRLHDLEKRRDAGHTSAVGGSAYPRMRFPRSVLKRMAQGKIVPVHCDGDYEDGELYCRDQFGRHPYNSGILDRCTSIEISGLYGSFKRRLFFFPNGKTVFGTFHAGLSRAESNAGAQLLYSEAGSGRHPRAEDMHIISDTKPLTERMSDELEPLVRASERNFRAHPAFERRDINPRKLPTLILFNLDVEELQEYYKDRLAIDTFQSPGIGKVHIGYLKLKNGRIVRLVQPGVGGYGLYGDCSGAFAQAAFDPEIFPNFVPHVLFCATAGVFSGTEQLQEFRDQRIAGLSSCPNGSLIMPTDGIWHKGELLTLPTLLNSKWTEPKTQKAQADFRKTLDRAGVSLYARHFCVPHPADETFENMEKICREQLASSIDVEGGHVLEAVLRYRNMGATFTPLYYCSDDPRKCKLNPYLTLAYGGVIHGAKVAHPGFPAVLDAGIELAFTEAHWD